MDFPDSARYTGKASNKAVTLELSVSHVDFLKNKLAYRRAGFLTRTGLFQNGKRLKSKRGKFQVTKDDGHTGVLELRRKLIDPIPVVFFDSQEIKLVRPFKWWELAWPCMLALSALFAGLYWVALLCLYLSPHLADTFRNDGSGLRRHYVFGLKAGFILILLFALAWLTYPRISPGP